MFRNAGLSDCRYLLSLKIIEYNMQWDTLIHIHLVSCTLLHDSSNKLMNRYYVHKQINMKKRRKKISDENRNRNICKQWDDVIDTTLGCAFQCIFTNVPHCILIYFEWKQINTHIQCVTRVNHNLCEHLWVRMLCVASGPFLDHFLPWYMVCICTT